MTTSCWRRVHGWPIWVRCPLKLGAFVLVVALVLFPKVWLLPAYVHRLRDMNSVLQPNLPALAEYEQTVRARARDKLAAPDMLRVVEQVVYERIPYAWDWDVWGVVDYLPTTTEVLEKGREDCDGRAVLAASILRRMGYEACLVSDLKHTWVATPAGETMSPGQGEKTIQAGPRGTQVRPTFAALENLGRGMSYGITVFPLTRELIIWAALCGLSVQPRSSLRRRVTGCLLSLLALGLLHDAGGAARGLSENPALTWAGVAVAAGGWLLLVIRGADRLAHEASAEEVVHPGRSS